MARSAKQYENQIKIVIVAQLSKQFRRAAIVDKIVARAESLNQVASKGLVSPESSKSIIPSRNDRWLINKNSVIVKVGSMMYGVPEFVSIRINLEYGLSKEYFWLTRESPRVAWRPDGAKIVNWIKSKGDRGGFTYKGKRLDVSDDRKVRAVSYAISKGIERKGIKKTSLFNPFNNKRSGVEATVDKAFPAIYERMNLLYGVELESAVVQMFEVFK